MGASSVQRVVPGQNREVAAVIALAQYLGEEDRNSCNVPFHPAGDIRCDAADCRDIADRQGRFDPQGGRLDAAGSGEA